MAVLFIDRDRTASEQLIEYFTDRSIEYVHAPTRDAGIEKMRETNFEAVIFDPAPQNEVRPFVIGARRMSQEYPYLILSSHTIDLKASLESGCNDLIEKSSLDGDVLDKKLENGRRLNALVKKLGDESEDFPSRDGMIAKSAFNQLFISCLDRADRYGEESYAVFIRIHNFDEIITKEGRLALSKASDELKKYVIRVRRLSDIAGHITPYEYALLLLRPVKDDEPKMAAKRISESLQQFYDLVNNTIDTQVKLSLNLIHFPTGDMVSQHMIG